MTDKNKAVFGVIKSLKEQKVTAREISKKARLTTGEVCAQLQKLVDKGLVERFFVGCHEYDYLYQFKGGEE
ncbi:MAG: helix-turn-helix domain-containing protein [Methanocorpusculum sp.]|nr:helix-turn-helix domain-containing protein [Methanocorpusculum sp.]